MKKHLLFNQLFGTEGSPNQTGETLTRENRIGLMSYLRRTLMLLFAVLVMSVANIGTAWGTDVFSAVPIAGSNLSAKNLTTFTAFTSSQATISGGTLSYKQEDNNEKGIINTSVGPTDDKRKCFRIEVNKCVYKMVLSGALQNGDVIAADLFSNNVELWFSTSESRPSSAPSTKLASGGTSSQWNAKSYTVTTGDGICGQTTIYIHRNSNTTHFSYLTITRAGGGGGGGCSDPTAPTAFATSSVTATTATFDITDAANAASYDIYTSTSSTDPTSGTTPTATGIITKTPTVTGLTAGTTYYAWVRAVCDASHKSDWVALDPTTFTTLAAPTASFSNSTYAIGGSALDLSSLWSSNSAGSVTYSVEDAAGTGASVSTASFSATRAGKAKVKAVQAANGSYDAITKYAYITVGSNVVGKHTVTYDLEVNVNKSRIPVTDSVRSTSLYLTTAEGDTLKGAGLSYSGGAKSGLTGKISAPASYDGNKYVYVQFSIASGYQLTLDSAWCVVQAVGDGSNQNGKLVISDTDSHSFTGSEISCPGTKAGAQTHVVVKGDGRTAFTGTVTLKIYVYGSDATYRLGEKINIHGTVASAASSCPDAWSFHSKNSSSEWRDPICMELEGNEDFYISEETAINVGDVSYKVGYQGADETKTTETDWQWMPMGPARNWTVGAHPTASNAGGALGYFYIHSSYTDNNRYIGFFPSSYMLRQGSGESWSNTTFNPASSAYGETVWTTTVQKFTASNAADYMYTALGTGNGGAVGCAMSTAMRPIYLKLHSDWKASSPKFYIYYFKNGTDKNGWSGLMQAVSGTGGDDLVGWIPEGDWDRVQFVRFNPGDAVASWDGNVWNSTYAITLDSEKNYYVLEAQGNGGALDWYGHWDLYHNGFYRIWVNNASTNFALHYVPQYVLEYDNNGGSGSIDPQSVALDADPNTVTVKAVTGFTAPTGKHFVNWNTAPGGGGTSYNPSDSYSLTADATLYAQWAWDTYDVSTSLTNVSVKTGTTGTDAATHGTAYTVTLQGATGYNLPTTVTVTIGGSPATLTTDYTWNSSTGVLTVLAAKVTGDISISATGVAKTTAITLEAGDGGTDGSATATYGTSTITGYVAATRTGYTLGNYYQDGSKNNILTKEGELNSGDKGSILDDGLWVYDGATITLYAQWTATSYTLSYDLAGGSVTPANPTSYTIESSAITLNNPTKTGYTFAGWTGTGLDAATTAVTIAAGSTGNRSYTATWTANTYDVDFSLTDVGYSSGEDEGTDVATYGTDFETVFTASTGYTLPDAITVTIGGEAATENTEYTWNSSTGAVVITGSYILGDIVITVTGEEEGDCTPSRLAKVTITGGSSSYTVTDSISTSTHNLQTVNGVGGKIKGSGYLQIYTGGTSLKTGDKVSVSIRVLDYSQNRLYMRLGRTTSTDTMSIYTGGVENKDTTLIFTIPKDGIDTISFTRATGKSTSTDKIDNQNHILKSVIISRPCAETTYELTWNTNGGSELVCTGTCTSGDLEPGTTLVAPNDPTLSNYTFDGWNTANDGSGTTAGATMPAANTTYYAAWKQTVTLTTGAQGSGDNQTPVVYLNGTGVSTFTAHTASGYSLQGYYTAGSGGTKVLNADGTFAAANVTDYITSSKWSRTGAAPTLYAQWLASEDCSTSDFVIQKGSSEQYQGCMESSSYNGTATSFTAGSATTVGNAKMTISNYKDGVIKRPGSGNTFSIVIEPVSGYYLKSICWAGKVEDDETVSYYWDNNSGSAATITPQTTSGTGVTYDAPNSTTTKFTASYTDDGDGSGGIWWRNVQVEVCAGGGTTYNVTYNGNDETGGTAPTDATNYSYGGTVTVKGNTGSLAKTNYSFVGWSTNDDGTGSNYVADNTFSITANTTLYAKWTQAVTFDANTANHGSTGGSATAVWNATGLTGITHATPASGYKLLGYYTAATSGTKVLNSDGSFAGDDITDWIDDGKWVQNDDDEPLLYAQYESAGALTWNLIVNSDTTNLSTSTKTSAFTEIAVANMTDAVVTGLTYTGNAKANLTGKISTPASEDAGKYVSVTFKVADGYKFTPSMIQVPVQPVGDGEHKAVELRLTDTNTHSLVSGSATKCDGTEKGKKTTVTLDGDGTYFTGTVTLKIYVYPHLDATATTNKCYRLGTPITIEGEIEEKCATMPSYTSMSYTTTTFAPNIDASGSPITIVGGENIDTYQWKYNTTNDRTSGTECGTGTSLTPLTNAEAATDVTRYYWCEMKNDACDITIKSPSVAITVASAKSDATVEWTDPVSTPNYGGGGYTIKATVEQTGWDGDAADLVITAPAGIRIYNVSSGTDGSRKYVQADFDVQTSFDRSTYASNIPFTVSAAATATYNAISNDHNVSYSACAGAGEGSSYNIRVRKAYTKGGPGNNYYYWDNTDGWISSPNPASSISSTNASSTMATEFDSVSNTNAEAVYVRTYHDNIKKIRIYADFRANNMTVTNVYKHNDFYTANSKYEVDYSVVYNGDEENSDLGDAAQGYVDITLSDVMMSANDILLVKFNTSCVRPLGAVITESSAGSLNTHLQWSGGLANNATVGKNTTDAYFTYSASMITENTNSLGAITYSSSDPSVATVDATGKVAMVAAGTTTIKATLAASGCYKKAEISYTLNVTEVACEIAAGTLTLTSGAESKCSSDNVTLTLTGFESGASIQWKDGDTDINNGGNYTIAMDGTNSTLTTNQEGTYSVMVTKDCSVRSNRITISNKSTEVGAKRIVKNWYIKNGRPTPDIELWTLQNGAHLSSVAWDPANTTGLTASDFYESDGKVYLKGKEPSSNTSADIDYTLTLTVADDCGSTTEMSASGQLIYLHHQKNTDKHVLAFVVTGTEKGGFTEGLTADQTTSVELYNTIAANFDVLATNVYSTDDEQALKEYYSQFDILCVTDYPNTGTKGVNKKSYVDALGALVDIRPILTMEAFVAKLANWKAKGISGTPQSPTTRQYSMLLQCKDHEIFAGTKLTKVGEGDETMYRVSMVDQTVEEYPTLDGYTPGSKDYNAGGKPALQGFTFTKEMLDDDLLPLGLIDDGSGNDLQVGIERQTEMEARLMVLGINSYAMERLTPDGQTVVVNALKYLMKKNSEDIADCSNTFVGGDDEEDESTRYDWNVDSHWSGNAIPDRTQKVRIVAPCVIKADEKFHVTGVVIAPIGKYNHGANTANGSLTIAAGGALIVDGKVEAATAPLYTETRATTPADLYIAADETKGNGTLIFDNEDGETQATVGYYSKATTDENTTWNWQYMAVPFNDNSSAYRNYYDSYLYRWAEDCSGWEVVPNRGEVYPWVGYCITQVGEKTYYMDGTLVETGEQVFTVPGGKDLVLGNSWSAPIQVKQLTDDDFVNLRKNVYLFNTGYDPDGGSEETGARYAASTYVTIPIHSATYTGDSMVSSLQAFIVYTDGALDGTLTLDYDRHVRPARSTDIVNAGPMHAPRRGASISEKPAVLKIYASGSRYDDRLVVLERGDFSTGLDDGWDGDKRLSGNVSPHLYAETDNGKESVSAIPDMEGTLLGFRAGEDNEYTLHFNYSEDEALYLLDMENNIYTPVNNESSYTFVTSDKSEHTRFILTRTAPGIATGVTDLDAAAPKVQKIIYNDKLYIIRGGKVYSADGQVVK